MRSNFVRYKENFKCLNCGHKVEGSGYTNHCPNCLYSRHVDLNIPGDRQNNCDGLMKPIGVLKKDDNYIILHQCVKCGVTKKNKMAKNDNFDEIIKIAKENP